MENPYHQKKNEGSFTFQIIKVLKMFNFEVPVFFHHLGAFGEFLYHRYKQITGTRYSNQVAFPHRKRNKSFVKKTHKFVVKEIEH